MTTQHLPRNDSIQRSAPGQPPAHNPEGHPDGLRAAAVTAVLAALAGLMLAACGGGSDGTAGLTPPQGGAAGLAGTWRQAGCTSLPDGSSAAQNFIMAPRPGDHDRVDISTELIVFSGSNCTGAFNRWPTGDIGSTAARRTESSAATTATWGRWTTTTGEVWSSVWHWRGSALCLFSGVLGQDSDPEIRLPTAAAVADFFARVPEENHYCYARQ